MRKFYKNVRFYIAKSFRFCMKRCYAAYLFA